MITTARSNGSFPTRWVMLVATAILLLFQCTLHHAHAASSQSPSASSATRKRHIQIIQYQQQQHHHDQQQIGVPSTGRHRQRQILRRQWQYHTHAFHTATLAQHSYNTVSVLEQLRGGGRGGSTASSSSSTIIDSPSRKMAFTKISKISSLAVTSILILILFIQHWDTIQQTFSTLFDTTKFRNTILQTLNDIASMGHVGLALYTLIFIFWEVCGLPTSVVETAAGMAFGFRKAFLGSFIGKSCGSSLAFILGRTLFSDMVRTKLEDIEAFGLIERGVEHHPVRSAFIVRYSVLPQIVKNFGISMTKPVSYPTFLLTIIVHGLPFSLLWAALGYDSSVRLRASHLGEVVPKNYVLNGLLVFVTVFGFVVSPAITGWWLADLRKEA